MLSALRGASSRVGRPCPGHPTRSPDFGDLASTGFFGKLVELLVRMGYGGTQDAGRALGRSSHDGGIDGFIIKEDHLGLCAIYFQAKPWQNNVGRPDVQTFAGSLEGERARKGVFITSSYFSNEAREFVKRIEKKIALIGGRQLAALGASCLQ